MTASKMIIDVMSIATKMKGNMMKAQSAGHVKEGIFMEDENFMDENGNVWMRDGSFFHRDGYIMSHDSKIYDKNAKEITQKDAMHANLMKEFDKGKDSFKRKNSIIEEMKRVFLKKIKKFNSEKSQILQIATLA